MAGAGSRATEAKQRPHLHLHLHLHHTPRYLAQLRLHHPPDQAHALLVSRPSMEIIDAELRLGPPGSAGGGDAGFAASSAAQKKRPSSTVAAATSEASGTDDHDAAPASKVQVVGWPPVGAYRKSTFQSAAAAAKESKGAGEAGSKQRSAGGGGGGLYVKVSMDGAPYLRKVDLRTYGGYRELLAALDALFVGCFSSCSTPDNAPFAMAYEDKDGDLMLAGDVPWDMFISSCKRLRIMRSSEAR